MQPNIQFCFQGRLHSSAIVYDVHEKYYHAGITLMVSIIRQKYWIIRLKYLIRITVHKCLKCIRQKPVQGLLMSLRVIARPIVFWALKRFVSRSGF